MKYFLTFSLICCISVPVFAETYLRDVPAGHWASDAVYDLVRTGVTDGFPDGTFRGNKDITRYEIAAFLAKFGKSIALQRGRNEKMIEEMKTEIALVKYQQKKDQAENTVSGELESVARASLSTPRGGQFTYRLKWNLTKTFDPRSSLRLSLDTLDAGFDSTASRDPATVLVDFEGKFMMGGLDATVSMGPGWLTHTDATGLFPSENNSVYARPFGAFKITGTTNKLSLSTAYVTRQAATSGKVGVHEITVKAGLDLGAVNISLRPRYVFVIGGTRDVLAELGVDLKPRPNLETNILLAAGDFSAGHSGQYLKLIQQIKNERTSLKLRLDKVGSNYRAANLAEDDLVALNNFNRRILDGTADFGLAFSHRLTEAVALRWMGDYVTTVDYQYGSAYAGTYFLWQLGLRHSFSAQAGLEVFYRAYNVPSGLAQFADPVPVLSETIGLGVKCAF